MFKHLRSSLTAGSRLALACAAAVVVVGSTPASAGLGIGASGLAAS